MCCNLFGSEERGDFISHKYVALKTVIRFGSARVQLDFRRFMARAFRLETQCDAEGLETAGRSAVGRSRAAGGRLG